ncbi:hypothetical protein VTJ04DRAFT_9782 [Mycothermus thermophilus]|uniref:uncharacterized protein n=1 Tax=Humicola insolens TaxID=85995 RepID=UPI0037424149
MASALALAWYEWYPEPPGVETRTIHPCTHTKYPPDTLIGELITVILPPRPSLHPPIHNHPNTRTYQIDIDF